MEEKMKKVLIGLVIVVALIGGGVVLLFSNLDKIVETGIETAGSNTLGTQVDVGSVSLDLVGGSASIFDFSVSNPVGYSNADMVSFDELTVAIDLQNTSSEQVHIRSVVARSPHVLYGSEGGTSNMDTVTARLESGETATAEESEAPQVMLIIDSILVENIRGTLVSDKLPTPAEVSLGDVRLSGLQGYPDELAEQIMDPILSQIGAVAAQAMVQAITDQLGAAADQLNEQLEGAGSDLQESLDDVSSKANEALESVGNLFKKD